MIDAAQFEWTPMIGFRANVRSVRWGRRSAGIFGTSSSDRATANFLVGKASEFRKLEHAAQWGGTLESYASTVLGKTGVGDIELADILRALEPIWHEKTETASRLRGRIESVLAWATVSGYRTGDNPAGWRGKLDAVLPKPSKIANATHHKALPIDDVPAFIAALRKRNGEAALVLEFLILTAARSGEVRGATAA